ncbi:EAL domain-containing protein [Pleurocapsa sp. PCC 7319]|uniref:EAL domain-containing protein n=1 Tax=Pleurocapsa sp. PCC 7319 TaxID=118161 RepID=UPI001181C20D|nr:EAL domain-containing protein [Pleurocapsa sp. PCC 7319]
MCFKPHYPEYFYYPQNPLEPERVLVDSGHVTQNNLAEIKRRKIKLSIDDFGTGYSSLSYLRRLPIDNLKIDRSFVDSINSDPESFEIVKTIITLAHTLGMDAIAEGVENIAQVERLKSLGCEFVQGYLFAEPLEPDAIESILSKYELKVRN